MNSGRNRHLLAVEYLLRVCGWLLVLNSEKVAGAILWVSHDVLDYYWMAIAITASFIIALRKLGRSPIIRDLEEICLYDVMVQFYGMAIFLLGFKYDSYLILANGIYILKFIRLIWWGKNLNGELVAAWPQFGLIGYTLKNRETDPISTKQRLSIYAAIFLAFLAAYLGWLFLGTFPPLVLHAISLVAVLSFTHRAANDLETREDERIKVITEKIELETRIAITAELHAEAVTSNQDLRGAAHDLNNPITAMTYAAREISMCQDLESAQASAKNLEAGLRDLSDLVVDVLEMARLGTKLKHPTDEIVAMTPLCNALKGQLMPLAKEMGVLVSFDDAPFAVTSNAWLLKRILQNLLMNAIVHGNKKTKVRLCLRSNGQFCYIRVWDTGPGMSNADSPNRAANFSNLLNTAHRMQKTSTEVGRVSGHGLGLRGVIRMCNILDVTMTLVSRPDKGTMFRFKVPLAAKDTQETNTNSTI